MNTTFMHLSIQLAQIRKFRIRRTFHFLDILGPAVEWSEAAVQKQNKIYTNKGTVRVCVCVCVCPAFCMKRGCVRRVSRKSV